MQTKQHKQAQTANNKKKV